MTVFQETVVESILPEPNQMVLVSFFSEDNVLSDDIKICYIFEYQINKNQAFRFFGTPGIVVPYKLNAIYRVLSSALFILNWLRGSLKYER